MRGARLACVKPAASVRSEPGSNSHVCKTLIWLVRRIGLNRRNLVTLESTRTFTPGRQPSFDSPRPGRLILSKRDPPKSRSNQFPWREKGSADSAAHVSLSSIFSFQRTDTANAMSWPVVLLAPGRPSVAYAALLISSNHAKHRSELLRRQQRHRRRWCGAYRRRSLGVSTARLQIFCMSTFAAGVAFSDRPFAAAQA